eukprot:6460277-Amphidinium_carterae.1
MGADLAWEKASLGRKTTWIGATLEVKLVRGQLAWASGMFSYLRSFNSCLWAALAANATEVRQRQPKHLIFVLRVVHALRWIAAALDGGVTRVRA